MQKLDLEDNAKVGRVSGYATAELAKLDPNTLDGELLRWLALFPPTANAVRTWGQQGKLKPQSLGMSFLKALAFQPDWDADPFLVNFRAANGQWAKELEFEEQRASVILGWFADVRKFSAAELGFEWLMKLVARSEPLYHDFASERLIRTFLPADFAPKVAAQVIALSLIHI